MRKRAGAYWRSAPITLQCITPTDPIYCRDSGRLDGSRIRDTAAENAKSEKAKCGEDPEQHMPQTRPMVGATDWLLSQLHGFAT